MLVNFCQEKSFHMVFWEQSRLILSPTSERTYNLVVLVQRVQSNSFKQVLKNYLNSVRLYCEKNVARINLFEVEAKIEAHQKTQKEGNRNAKNLILIVFRLHHYRRFDTPLTRSISKSSLTRH